MPIARVQMPDGRIARLDVPEGTTPEQVTSFAANLQQAAPQQAPPAQSTQTGYDVVRSGLKNLAAGAVQGAGNIGATILSPLDKSGLTGMTTDERRQKITEGLQTLTGADPSSLAFKGGELGSEIAGTSGVGGSIAKGVRFLPEALPVLAKYAPKLAAAIESGGFKLGTEAATTTAGKVADAATRVAGGAITGGASAGLVDPSSAKAGAVIGAAMPAGVKVAGSIGGSLAGMAAPFTNPKSIVSNAVKRLAGQNAETTAERIASAPQYVQGSIPTAAQAAPSPMMIQAEKTLMNNPDLKPLFVQRELANNQARLDALDSVAGPPGVLEEAKAERDRIAKNLYGYAFEHPPEPSDITPWVKSQITQLTKRPAMQAAMKDAKTLALNEGIKLNDATSIQGLHYAKLSLDDQIGKAFSAGNNNEGRVLMGTRDKLLTLMDELSPTYAQARQEFAKASQPINTMELANELRDKISTNVFDANGMPKIDYRGYRSALAKALGNSEYGIDPKAQTVLENIQKDLQRATASNAVRTSGSDTAFNLAAPGWLAQRVYGKDYGGPTGALKVGGMVLGSALGEALMPGHTLAALAMGGGSGLGAAAKIGKIASQGVNREMAETMLDPGRFAKVLSSQAGNAGRTKLSRLVEAAGDAKPLRALAYSTPNRDSQGGRR